MISRRHFAALFAGTLTEAAAQMPSGELVAEVRKRLATEQVTRGNFEQRKLIKGFRNPLQSSGDFVIAQGRGLLWRTRSPLASTLVIARDQVLLRQADGTTTRKLQAGAEPALRAMTDTLLALVAADLGALAQRFRMDGATVGDGWRLQLTPNDAALMRAIQTVELTGARYLRSIRVDEASGDQTQIQLSAHAGSASLSRGEEAQFE